MALELKFDVKPDEHGVFDGRDLAEQLIYVAYRLLVPYVNACPACTDSLFTVIANNVIENLHHGDGMLPGTVYAKGEGEERHKAETAHFNATVDRTRELLRQGNATHDHGDHTPA
jgi:hypothetical protein